MGKKKRSVLAEIKRTNPNRKKSKWVKGFSFLTDSYELDFPPPPSMEKDGEKHLDKLYFHWEQAMKEIAPSLHQAKKNETGANEIRQMLAQKIQDYFDNYFDNYSLEEKHFLITSFLFEDFLIISEVISGLASEKSPTRTLKLFNLIKEKREMLIIGWLNYQIFRSHLPEMQQLLDPAWRFVEKTVFG